MSSPPKVGLVVGKFYPPHLGHHYLIDEALSQCAMVIVLVTWSSRESISVEDRVDILRKRHPGAFVKRAQDENRTDYDDPAVWDAHTRVIRDGLDLPYTAVPSTNYVLFSSERYGPELAQRLGVKHEMVDRGRINVPISATAIRKAPFTNWKMLTPYAKALLTRRIVVLGAESTGTTTLTKQLAEHYKTVWVPEYGRTYTECAPSAHQWTEEDFIHIADIQNRTTDGMAQNAGPVMFIDTDAYATEVWAERYLGYRPKQIFPRNPDAYIITSPHNVAWVEDGTRDGEGEVRDRMADTFLMELHERQSNGAPFALCSLYGGPQRLPDAISFCDRRLEQGFVDPL